MGCRGMRCAKISEELTFAVVASVSLSCEYKGGGKAMHHVMLEAKRDARRKVRKVQVEGDAREGGRRREGSIRRRKGTG
jgi:hypothetical protein